jgi:hypothetical protein
MKSLYHFPKTAAFGKVLSKSKIYEHATPTSKVKALFIEQVEKIIWAYKLSPETINLSATQSVREIQVLTIALRTSELATEVLQTIDKAIPSPILFVLSYQDKYRYVAAYKRPNETDQTKWVISHYFETPWINDLAEKKELPLVLNMAALYHFFLKKLIALPLREGETLDELILRVQDIQTKEREASHLESKIKKEKQFNRKVAFNRTLNTLKQDIENLKC